MSRFYYYGNKICTNPLMLSLVYPEPDEGKYERSWFDRLTTNGCFLRLFNCQTNNMSP
jgi:hypothetical protein